MPQEPPKIESTFSEAARLTGKSAVQQGEASLMVTAKSSYHRLFFEWHPPSLSSSYFLQHDELASQTPTFPSPSSSPLCGGHYKSQQQILVLHMVDNQCTKLCSFVSNNLYFYIEKRGMQIAYIISGYSSLFYVSLYVHIPNLTVQKRYTAALHFVLKPLLVLSRLV